MKELSFNGKIFIVFDSVYEPSDDSFMAAYVILSDCSGEFDLSVDVGSGCGLLSVLLAERSKFTVAVDVSLEAARNTKLNAKRNNVWYKMSVIVGDLLEVFKRKPIFDCMVFNPPYLPESEGDVFIPYKVRIAWSGGRDGRALIDRFLKIFSMFLRFGGVVYLVQSSLSDLSKTLFLLSSLGFRVEVLDEKHFFYETLYLIKVVK
ncbi:MAG: methyltransferase [archaeon GB-1867-035]|nr:methyltransferase [Candidatus Culexmicrobium profundum]